MLSRRRSGRRAAAATALFALLACASGARADRSDEVLRSGRVPRLPAPFALPELTHSRLDLRMDWFVGSATPNDASRSNAALALARPSIEAIIPLRHPIFLGVAYPFAAALPPDGGLASVGEVGPSVGTRGLLGNVEAHIRAVFALPMWLETGFTLGLVAPTATFDRSDRPNRSVVAASASLDPTSYVNFLPDRVTLRPAGDLRIVRGPFVFQGRHGLDIVIDYEGKEQVNLAGRLIGHAGYLVRSDLELSLEASQFYFFGAETQANGSGSIADNAFAKTYRIADDRRSAVVFGPGLRFALDDVDIGAALVTNIDAPLSPVVADFIGFRVSVIGHVRTRR